MIFTKLNPCQIYFMHQFSFSYYVVLAVAIMSSLSSSSSSSRNHGALSTVVSASEWCVTWLKTELRGNFPSVNTLVASIVSIRLPHPVLRVTSLPVWNLLYCADKSCCGGHLWLNWIEMVISEARDFHARLKFKTNSKPNLVRHTFKTESSSETNFHS